MPERCGVESSPGTPVCSRARNRRRVGFSPRLSSAPPHGAWTPLSDDQGPPTRTIEKLRHANILYLVVSKFCDGNPHPTVVKNEERKGKAVLCEKPLEVSSPRRARRWGAGGRFPDAARARCAVAQGRGEAGRFGRLTLGSTYVKWWRAPEYYASSSWKGTWRWMAAVLRDDGGSAIKGGTVRSPRDEQRGAPLAGARSGVRVAGRPRADDPRCGGAAVGGAGAGDL